MLVLKYLLEFAGVVSLAVAAAITLYDLPKGS